MRKWLQDHTESGGQCFNIGMEISEKQCALRVYWDSCSSVFSPSPHPLQVTNDTKLCDAVHMPDGWNVIQRHLARLSSRSRWTSLGSKIQVQGLALGSQQPPLSIQADRRKDKWEPCWNGLRYTGEWQVGQEQAMCVLRAHTASHILDYIKRNMVSRARDLILPLYSVHSVLGHKNDPRDGMSALWGQADRAGVVQPEEGKHVDRPESGLSVFKGVGGYKKKNTNSLVMSVTTGQGERF